MKNINRATYRKTTVNNIRTFLSSFTRRAQRMPPLHAWRNEDLGLYPKNLVKIFLNPKQLDNTH
jgi:hypothetical protein